jgi:hypothetical protein
MKSLSPIRTYISDKSNRTPYGARVDLILGSDSELDFEGELCLLTDKPHIITIGLLEAKPREQALLLKRLRACIEGFASAAEAEQQGLQLALALLWLAVSKRVSMRLDYHTPFPSIVYDRTRSGGISMSAEARFYRKINPNDFTTLLNQGLSPKKIPIDNLLLSMELFAAAQQEVTKRARYVALVSALEPLATAAKLGPEVDALIKEFTERLQGFDNIAQPVKMSLNGRLQQLRKESIAQAITRVVTSLLPNDTKALKTVRDAYDLRSKMLHEGKAVDDLNFRSQEIENYIRLMYASAVGYELDVGPVPA